MDYESLEELVASAEEAGLSIGERVLADQTQELEQPKALVYQRMDDSLAVMEVSVRHGKNKDIRSTSGLTGGDAWKMEQYALGGGICGEFMSKAVANALAVAEYNAAMGRIVAAPTAGSCGIMPGALVTLMNERGIAREKVVLSMFTAAAVGMVIAKKASLSGAQGGCQAECGAAAAMTAAAVTELMGGSPRAAANACAMAMKNQLGLACDPVAGLVEIPCIKRNASGVVIALTSADMALAGIESRIPADEVIMAMKEIGDTMPCAIRETAKGGLANTPTGKRLREQVFGK